MRKILLSLPFLLVLSTSAFANDATKKVSTIRMLYSEITEPFDYSHDSSNNLYRYSSRDFQNSIALSKANMPSLSHDYYESAISECDEVGNNLKLVPPIDADIRNVNYQLLRNGNVRATINFIPSYTDFVDFSLDCRGSDSDSTCKITDLINSHGISAKSEIQKYCR